MKLVQEKVELARGGDVAGLLSESDESEEEEVCRTSALMG